MKYPNGKLNIKTQKTTLKIMHQNRGMTLENDINHTNQFYKNNKIAFIYKKPTPIKVVKVDYKTQYPKICEAYFETPSTTDYNGIYKGHYLDFEAKETSLLALPLVNIHQHQLDHMKNCFEQGGTVFLITKFTKLDKVYVLMYSEIQKIINLNKKSISHTYFQEHGYLIKPHLLKRVDYLKIIDEILQGV